MNAPTPQMIRAIALVLVAAGLSACAAMPLRPEIKPDLHVQGSDLGKGRAVGVLVTDTRDSQEIGARALRTGDKLSEQNLAEAFRQAVFDGLKAKGFAPTDISRTVDRQLAMEIRSIDYAIAAGFFAGGIDAKAVIKASVTLPGNSYERVYRSTTESRVGLVSTAGHNAELLNKVVNEALSQAAVIFHCRSSRMPPAPVRSAQLLWFE